MAEFIVRFLRQLRDVTISSPADGDVLSYDAGSSKWVNSASAGGGGGAPTDADYLVGTANAGLTNEIAVGASPGGELGGTWASPTVDTVHSGSSHATVQAAAEATAASALSAHEADTTGIHGIADTSLLLDTGDIGNSVEAHDADLTAIAGLAPTNDDVLQRKAGAWTNRTIAQLLSDLASPATTFQPLDSDLTSIAALDSSTSGAIASDGAGWIKKTYAQFKTALSLTASDVGLGNVTNNAQLKASDLDTDGTLAANSDTKIPSQKAVKTYVDANAGGGGGGTKTILLSPGSAVLPDGSTSNLAPGMTRRQGSQTGAKAHFLTLDFDGGGNLEGCHWVFRLPSDYASGGTLKLLWMANATANNVKWQAEVGAITPADADTPLEHAFAAAATVTTSVNTTEARRLTESAITLTMDSAAAGDLIELYLFRDSADASDTATVDAELIMAAVEYS